MVAVGPQLRQAAVLDRRDHAAQRLADAAEGDPLLDRHRGRVYRRALPASVTTVPVLQGYTRFVTPWQGLRRLIRTCSVRRIHLT